MGGSVLEAVEYKKDVGGHCATVHEAQLAVCQGGSKGQRDPGTALQSSLVQGQVHLLEAVQGVRPSSPRVCSG